MDLTKGQRVMLRAAKDWWVAKDQRPFLVEGYAGTGKTTLIQYIMEELCGPGRAAAVAFTGKAVKVLRSKVTGFCAISTIHSACYKLEGMMSPDEMEKRMKAYGAEKNTAKRAAMLAELKKLAAPRWVDRPCFAWDEGDGVLGASLLVVDEGSMVGQGLGKLIQKLRGVRGTRLIVVRDPFQLPPVGDAPWLKRSECAAPPALTDIVRQKEGSSILALATHIRGGGRVRACSAARTMLVRMEPSVKELAKFDAVICGLNKTRHRLNASMREYYGHSGRPRPGEPLIALANDPLTGVLNGDIFEVVQVKTVEDKRFVKVRYDDGSTKVLELHMEDPEATRLTGFGSNKLGFAYAITAHKSQGSEYGKVCVFDESWAFRKDGHASRWLYTAVTRAADSLLLVTR